MSKPEVVSWSALISRYARPDIEERQKRSLRIEPNVVSCNGMIAGFNQNGCYSESVLMFQKMHSCGLKPNGTGVSSVLYGLGYGGFDFG
ncbi:hypothetical protein RHGRI_009204 [Rhododendron griersonianum]|uniref:Pentatricopeptide repeat-containing protein n=1 Tax=Rhododendron griersonianum TaxID=479676 RepID=A0AAV6L5P7_9ERIC|nr:hypothetical protein RHGRI_009204 [Rhododendron griersonianum]